MIAVTSPRHTLSAPQILLFDADDTLWENNIYFERAIARFISYLDHAVHTPAEVRTHLNLVERRTIARYGYGTNSFYKSLMECFEELSKTVISEQQRLQISAFVDAIVLAEIEIIAGVPEALTALSARHRLILVTKGNPQEQRDKLKRSGLAPLFEATEILAEKNAEAYRGVLERHVCPPAITWMIGNSPRSDINPALDAGLNAVFIPHSDTWILEHEEVREAPPGQTLLKLPALGELARYLEPHPALLPHLL